MSDSPPDDITPASAPSVRPDKAASDLKAKIAELEVERDRRRASLEADLHAARVDLAIAQKTLAAAEAERDRLVRDVGAARGETAEVRAAADRQISELSGSIRQLSETFSEALSEAKAREERALSEADKTRAWARSEADKAIVMIAEFRALPWWRRLLSR
jgi:hypothetical protein